MYAPLGTSRPDSSRPSQRTLARRSAAAVTPAHRRTTRPLASEMRSPPREPLGSSNAIVVAARNGFGAFERNRGLVVPPGTTPIPTGGALSGPSGDEPFESSGAATGKI